MPKYSNIDFKKYLPVFPVLQTEHVSCIEHGPFDNHLMETPAGEVWSDCPACIAREIEFAPRKAVEEHQRKHKADSIERLFSQASIPERFKDKTLSNYTPPCEKAFKILQSAKNYIANWGDVLENGKTLIFYGNPGCGKTHLSVSIAKEIMNAGFTACYLRQVDIGRIIRESYKEDSKKTEREAISKFTKPDLLIIDEIAHEMNGHHDKTVLHDVLNLRYDMKRPTILITNLSFNGIDDYIDYKTLDRLKEGDGGKRVFFDWESYRGNK